VKVSLFFILIHLSVAVFALEESAQSFVFQGRLFDVAGTNPLNDQVEIKFEIYNPDASCLLYSEVQTVDVASSGGSFAVTVGSAIGTPKRTLSGTDPGLSMAVVFRNDPLTSTRGCYTPTAGDGRLLRVKVTPQSTGIEETLSPDQIIASVGSALVAETLQGLSAAAFVQKDLFVSDVNIAKIFGNPTVSDASALHHHDGRYILASSSSSQDIGSGGFTSLGIGAVGTGTPLLGSTLTVQTASATAPGILVRASGTPLISDLRLKENLVPVKTSLEKITRLNAYNYYWKDKKRLKDSAR
jgi:Chaperone of endosialidase